MSHTSVSANLLQSFQVLSEFIVECVGKKLTVLPVDDIPLSIEEPVGNFILSRILDNSDNAFEFFSGKLSSTKRQNVVRGLNRLLRSTSACWLVLVQRVNDLFDNDVRVSSTNAFNLSQREHDFILSVNVGVEETENVLE